MKFRVLATSLHLGMTQAETNFHGDRGSVPARHVPQGSIVELDHLQLSQITGSLERAYGCLEKLPSLLEPLDEAARNVIASCGPRPTSQELYARQLACANIASLEARVRLGTSQLADAHAAAAAADRRRAAADDVAKCAAWKALKADTRTEIAAIRAEADEAARMARNLVRAYEDELRQHQRDLEIARSAQTRAA
jgi:hypothetical protein